MPHLFHTILQLQKGFFLSGLSGYHMCAKCISPSWSLGQRLLKKIFALSSTFWGTIIFDVWTEKQMISEIIRAESSVDWFCKRLTCRNYNFLKRNFDWVIAKLDLILFIQVVHEIVSAIFFFTHTLYKQVQEAKV